MHRLLRLLVVTLLLSAAGLLGLRGDAASIAEADDPAKLEMREVLSATLATSGVRTGACHEKVLGDAEGVASKTLRSEEHTSELQSRQYLVCRLLLEKKTT